MYLHTLEVKMWFGWIKKSGIIVSTSTPTEEIVQALFEYGIDDPSKNS
jgi:hypothetical protein